jgi:hypothetical protein
VARRADRLRVLVEVQAAVTHGHDVVDDVRVADAARASDLTLPVVTLEDA